jgi:hypothetical protein
MSAIAAASVKVKGFSVWFVFIIVTFIQFIGNIYFSYTEIDEASRFFKQWVELTSPVMDSLGVDITDPISQKRVLALLEGGLLPLISLTCLHFFIQYEGKPTEAIDIAREIEELQEELEDAIEEEANEDEKLEEQIIENEEKADDLTEIAIESRKENTTSSKTRGTFSDNYRKPVRKPGLLSEKMKRFGR